jgi:hypothetical protein
MKACRMTTRPVETQTSTAGVAAKVIE